jgi:hypothetical protein
MRLILKLVIFLVTVAAPCPAGAQFASPEVLYQDPNWQLTASQDQRDRTCLVAAREQPVAGPPTGIFMIYVARMASLKVQIVRIELMGPPREYLASGRSTTVMIDLGPAFRRSLHFQPLHGMFPTIATDRAADDLDRFRQRCSRRAATSACGSTMAWSGAIRRPDVAISPRRPLRAGRRPARPPEARNSSRSGALTADR